MSPDWKTLHATMIFEKIVSPPLKRFGKFRLCLTCGPMWLHNKGFWIEILSKIVPEDVKMEEDGNYLKFTKNIHQSEEINQEKDQK